jgi:2,4-dienoyl-CoA reductase-like NADH-dependent reductase (Old Yellow Enzyme family)
MPHLLEPLNIRALRLRNRLVLPPMATSKARPDGTVSDELLAYYDEKSRGGALGLAITEHCFISEAGRNRVGQPSAADDAMIDGLSALAAVFRRNGVPTVVQISHAGAASAEPGKLLVGPSDVATPLGSGRAPRPLTADEIADIPRQFAAAARRVKDAGFDGVELHSAHGYLLNQFLSPFTNRRTDRYGGPLENRIRLHLEVISAVRDEVGADFPLLLRLGARDYLEGGTAVADGVEAARRFELAGVDALDVTGGLTGYVRPGVDEPGYFAELSAPIKSTVAVPVILTGGVTEAGQAERLLARGAADLIGVGRALLRDSAWAIDAVRAAAAWEERPGGHGLDEE